MEFRVLGPVEVCFDGETVDLGGPRERALLARLIMSANHVVGADTIADDLWERNPPQNYAGTLRVYVSRLRRALGNRAGVLVTQPPGYRLNIDDGLLDARRFSSLAAAGAAELQAGRAQAAAGLLDQALDLWRGPALADIADQAFAQAYAARLDEDRLAATASKMAAELACGRHATVIGELDQLADSYPMREQFWSLRILALYRCGRQADALDAYGQLRAVLAEQLGIDPSPALRTLHERVLRQDPDLDWRPGSGTRETAGAGMRPDRAAAGLTDKPATGLEKQRSRAGPHETTSFIGREKELATIAELLALSRLVTLTGPGGSGKSRLARRYAEDAQTSHPGGVWLVELAALTGPQLVGATLAAALSVREEPGVPLLDSVATRLADSQVLLIMDNCEHVLDGAAETATRLLRACPAVRVLATSQSRLSIDGEASWPVPPLTLPSPAAAGLEDISRAEAVRLLCDRAALARPGFRLSDDNAPLVADICRRLDGIPLAIELAAARLNVLSARQIATRLDDRFRLLAGGSRAALARHRALLAAIEWSHDLLKPAEQVCLRRLAVFNGGCTLEAAEAVCQGDQLAAEVVFETVSSLVNRSLLTTEERAGSMRYGMLESIRHYAGQQLDAAGERPELERRHLAWLLDYAGQADFDGPDQGAWLELFDADLDNFRAGLERALDATSPCHGPERALELAGLLAPFWQVRGPFEPGRHLLAVALAAAGSGADPRLRAVALDGVGRLALHQGDEAQLVFQQESLAIWRSLGDLAAIARCLGDLGAVEHVRGNYAAARARYAEALELATRTADETLMARSLSGLARLAGAQNNWDQAAAYYEEAMAKFQAAGDLRRATTMLGNLGIVAFQQGRPELSVTRLREHLANARQLGDRKLIGGALTNLGDTLFHIGELTEAGAAQRQALETAEQIGDRRMAAVALTNLGMVACAQRDYGAAWQYLQRGLAQAVAIGERQKVYEFLDEIAALESVVGRADRAARLFGAAAALRGSIGLPVQSGYINRLRDAAATAELALGQAQYTGHRQAGEAMSEAEAITYATTGPEPAGPGHAARPG